MISRWFRGREGALTVQGEPVEVRASARRRRSLSARREGGRIVVDVPASLTARQRGDLIEPLVVRFLERERRGSAPRGDADLTARAEQLYDHYLAPVAGPRPALGARWVTNQNARWGSCTPSTGELRLSHRLQAMPAWVVDYVIVHELAHLIEPHHGRAFRALESTYPDADRAQAFLDGCQFAWTRPQP